MRTLEVWKVAVIEAAYCNLTQKECLVWVASVGIGRCRASCVPGRLAGLLVSIEGRGGNDALFVDFVIIMIDLPILGSWEQAGRKVVGNTLEAGFFYYSCP